MSDLSLPLESDQDYQRRLNVLVRSVKLARDFNLIFLHCNYRCLRQHIQKILLQKCPEVRELNLSSYAQSLNQALETVVTDQQAQAVIVDDLEQVTNLSDFLVRTNQNRDQFQNIFPFPLLIWITDDVQKIMTKVAPDFLSLDSAPVRFRLSSKQLLEFLAQEADQLFTNVFKTDVEDLIYVKYHHHCLLKQEVKSALRDLDTEGIDLEPELAASVKFALGKDDYERDVIEGAIAKFTDSLTFWEQQRNFARQGITNFYLGLCYLRKSDLNRAESVSHWEVADSFFQQALAAFESGELQNLQAKFIGYRGEVLKLLERWSELNILVQDSLTLHQVNHLPRELARDYGFLAEIDLNYHQNYLEVCEHAQQALGILKTVPDSEKLQGKYLLSLAQAQKNLDQIPAAINTLEQAYQCSNPDDNPILYIRILETLSKLHYEQKEYKQAFNFKQEQRAIENQYGFRAFIGAGCLQSPRQAKNNLENSATVAQEIAVSGRQQDVDKIIERIIVRNDYKLTIIHGQLGVGKSSTIKAGLIPSLQEKTIEARDVIPVFLESYSNWTKKLGKELVKQLKAKQKANSATISSIPEVIQQLHSNDQHNLFTVLIFDQFEEFFFIHQNLTARKDFFKFLSKCLDINCVKMILSLREDYLHYLLEWERYNNLDAINGDILTKANRYELHNFSVSDAKKIMQNLTQRYQFDLETALVNQVVEDLAEEHQEIRPIELQVVGAELQSEKITTLAQYQELGANAKERLVENYLEEVIKDCGAENEEAARVVLYLLTGENNTRPPKTREELEVDLKAVEKDLSKQAEKLDLVLNIFQKSGLVFLLPEFPTDRYQLVHDYLVSFIRKKQPKIDKLVQDLEDTRQQLKLTELEKELAEEQHKRTEEQYKLSELEKALIKKNKDIKIRNLTLVLIVVIGTTTMFTWQSNQLFSKRQTENLDSYKEQIGTQIRETIKVSIRLTEKLLLYQDKKEALLESLWAGRALKQRFNMDIKDDFSLGQNYEDTPEDVIKLLQETIKKVNQGEKLSEEEFEYLEKDVRILQPKDQYNVLCKLLKIGRKYAPQS